MFFLIFLLFDFLFSNNFCIFAEIFYYMKKINWKDVWAVLRKYLINKYIITLLLFAVVLVFVGQQSLVSRVKMAHQIRGKEKLLREKQQQIADVEADLRALDDPDSLERFAREHYNMRADDEDVFLIEEK